MSNKASNFGRGQGPGDEGPWDDEPEGEGPLISLLKSIHVRAFNLEREFRPGEPRSLEDHCATLSDLSDRFRFQSSYNGHGSFMLERAEEIDRSIARCRQFIDRGDEVVRVAEAIVWVNETLAMLIECHDKIRKLIPGRFPEGS